MRKSTSGFTIVELLIVIVIIAILAAITIVAFTGITGRANDSSMQADLQNAAKSLAIYKTLNGSYPTGTTTNVEAMLTAANLKFSRNVYDTDPVTANANLFYVDNNSGEDFGLVVKSKSGKTMYFSSKVGAVKDYPGSSFPQSGNGPIRTALGGMDGNHVWGYGGGVWSAWVKQ